MQSVLSRCLFAMLSLACPGVSALPAFHSSRTAASFLQQELDSPRHERSDPIKLNNLALTDYQTKINCGSFRSFDAVIGLAPRFMPLGDHPTYCLEPLDEDERDGPKSR
jgi:hypothetical protein